MPQIKAVTTLAILLAFAAGLGAGCSRSGRSHADVYADSRSGTMQAAPTAGDPEEQVVIRVSKAALPSVVSVEQTAGMGSGVFIQDDGVLLTNAHVVGDADTVTIGLADGRRLDGKVLGRDPSIDVAVVKVSGKFPTAPLADSDHLQVGQTAIAIGNPLGLDRTVTTGVVSATNRNPRGIGLDSLIQTDAAINPGNSGGPLLDSQGRVMGINTAIFSSPGGGLGFAIPINVGRDAAKQIVATGHVKRALLGVGLGDVTPEVAARLELPVSEGAAILQVAEGSPAAKAGLQQGDIVVEADGTPVKNSGDLRRLVRSKSPGDPITLTVRRAGETNHVTARLASAPQG